MVHERHHRNSQKVFYLAVSQIFHCRIIRRSFDAAVEAYVVIRAVAIFFAVGFVMFTVIRDKVIERKTIMTGYKVDALFRFTFLMTIDFRLPSSRSAKRDTEPSSPRKKWRASSRNRPFHSFQLSPMKLPT